METSSLTVYIKCGGVRTRYEPGMGQPQEPLPLVAQLPEEVWVDPTVDKIEEDVVLCNWTDDENSDLESMIDPTEFIWDEDEMLVSSQ